MFLFLDSPDALENIPEKWTPEVIHFYPLVPIIMVGNKKVRIFLPQFFTSMHGTDNIIDYMLRHYKIVVISRLYI